MMSENSRHSSEISAAENCRDTPVAQKTKRIEELLLDENPQQVSFRQLAEQEIRSMDQGGWSWRWISLIVALVICVGAIGWYFTPLIFTTAPPATAEITVEKRQVMPDRPELQAAEGIGEALDPSGETTSEVLVSDATAPEEMAQFSPVADESVYRVLAGPFIRQGDVDRAVVALQTQGFQPQLQRGSGPVTMIRLLEGLYPAPEAEQRLQQLKRDVPSAFKLRDGERWALYVGSFYDRERAERLQKLLTGSGIPVNQVEVELIMDGTLLVILHADYQAAKDAVDQIDAAGIKARIER